MLVDSAYFEGPGDIVADNVNTLPSPPAEGMMVYLLAVDGAFVPGLYLYSEGAWQLLTDSGPL